MDNKFKDITGNRYGNLVATSCTNQLSSNKDYIWYCSCDCGNLMTTTIGRLNSGHTKSCGCLSLRKGKDNPLFKHGMRNTKVFKTWCKIKERCYNVNCNEYEIYGGRGITLSPYFKDNFLAFYNEVGDPPDDLQKWSIDRIDNNGNYEKGNLRWATSTQQARNKGRMKNNTTGFNGVSWYNQVWTTKNGEEKSCLFAVSQWRDVDGKAVNKKFNVNKLGLLEAFSAACSFRRAMVEKLNQSGAGYSENHGTVRFNHRPKI